MRFFPRINFTRGFTRLTLLSSKERVDVLLALIVVLKTNKGRDIINDRFSPGFDERRKSRAARFSSVGDNTVAENDDGDLEDEEDDEILTEVVDEDVEALCSI